MVLPHRIHRAGLKTLVSLRRDETDLASDVKLPEAPVYNTVFMKVYFVPVKGSDKSVLRGEMADHTVGLSLAHLHLAAPSLRMVFKFAFRRVEGIPQYRADVFVLAAEVSLAIDDNHSSWQDKLFCGETPRRHGTG
jgi:hypothetical protein